MGLELPSPPQMLAGTHYQNIIPARPRHVRLRVEAKSLLNETTLTVKVAAPAVQAMGSRPLATGESFTASFVSVQVFDARGTAAKTSGSKDPKFWW